MLFLFADYHQREQYLILRFDHELTDSTSALAEADRMVKEHWESDKEALGSGVCAQWLTSRSRMCQSAAGSRKHGGSKSPTPPSYLLG